MIVKVPCFECGKPTKVSVVYSGNPSSLTTLKVVCKACMKAKDNKADEEDSESEDDAGDTHTTDD